MHLCLVKDRFNVEDTPGASVTKNEHLGSAQHAAAQVSGEGSLLMLKTQMSPPAKSASTVVFNSLHSFRPVPCDFETFVTTTFLSAKPRPSIIIFIAHDRAFRAPLVQSIMLISGQFPPEST